MVSSIRTKIFMAITLLVFMIAIAVGFYKAYTKLTFLEYTIFNDDAEGYIALDSTGENLSQEFEMPYDILHSIAVKIGTFNRVNNSEWLFSVSDAETGKVVTSKTFFASVLSDNQYYKIEFDKNVRLEQGKKYVFTIRAEDVNSMTALAFYGSSADHAENTGLRIDGRDAKGTLCFKVYGGNFDVWWMGYAGIITLYFIALFLRILLLQKKGMVIHKDIFIQSLLAGGFAFLLLFTFSTFGAFVDEYDNIHGGLAIVNGGVLYKDYITQHTPVTYYLCAVFALLGASSLEQFRLSYYITEAIVWGLVYLRYSEKIGRRKLFILPAFSIVVISSVVPSQGTQILSDGIQGICTVIMLLEFLLYMNDKRISWSRSIIMSIGIWGCIGTAFISAYALICIFVAFCIVEILYIWKKTKISVKKFSLRYYRLLISVITPPMCAVVYFQANGCLKRAFDMFYTFNREVYPKYLGGFGNSIVYPFISGINNFFSMLSGNLISIVTAQATTVIVLRFIIIFCAFILLIQMMLERRYVETVLLASVMIFSATRGYDFHGLAAWYVAALIIVLHENELIDKIKTYGLVIRGVCFVLLFCPYISAVANNLSYKQESISELEYEIIELTKEEENKNIFYDAYTYETLYIHYKNRNPVNPGVYILPWYMAWYEQDNIDSILKENPHVVVYNENNVVWEKYQYFTNSLANSLRESGYVKLSNNPEDGWKYYVWVQ